MKLKVVSNTKAFLDKLADKETKKISLAEVIANAVVLYIDQNDAETVEKLKLQIDIIKGLPFPEVIVKPGKTENSLQSIVQFSGPVDKSLMFDVPVSMTQENTDQLIWDISNVFDSASGDDEIANVRNAIPEPFIREETILPPLDPCPYGKIKYNIDLKKKEIMIPGVTCETQHFDCSTLPMKFYSFSGKPATTPSEY